MLRKRIKNNRQQRQPSRQIDRLFVSSLLLLLTVFLPPASSFVPPPRDVEPLEPIEETRRRLGQAFNYAPKLIHPELCRYLTEDECRDADESLQEHGRKMRQLSRIAGQQRKLRQTTTTTAQSQQPPNNNNNNNNHLRALSEVNATTTSTSTTQHVQDERQLNPSVGIVKVLVLLINFPDHTERDLIDPSIYDEMWNGNGKSDLIPSGSVARWFQLNSYGLYDIEAVIVPWTQADNTELYYSFGNSGLTPDFQRSFWPALDKLDQNGIDWSQYDIDQDGVLDAVVALHSGYGAELKGEDCNTKRDYVGRIWSHAYANSFNSWNSADGRYRVGGYVAASAFRDRCGSEPARIGIMTHEFMHTFGLVDLYDGQEARVGRGIGGFDIMATPYGPKDDPSWPGHLSAWSRIMSGWLKPIEIVEDGEYSIQASELSNQAYIIRKPYPFDEYLLIENRQPLWFDARLWTGGLVIYHVDDRADLQMKRGYPGQEGWPRNGNHYQVAVLASDGQYNLEKGDNVGDVGDFWKEGMTLGPGNGRVFPNTDAYQFGSIRATGVTIYDIKQVDTVMTFRVSGLTETPAPTTTEPNAVVSPPTTPSSSPTPSPDLPVVANVVDGSEGGQSTANGDEDGSSDTAAPASESETRSVAVKAVIGKVSWSIVVALVWAWL